MSWKPTLWLLAMVVLTGLFIVVFEKNTDQSVRPLPLNSPLLPLGPDVITRLSVSDGTSTVTCVRRGGEWFLSGQMEARADKARINRLIDAVIAIREQEVVDPVRREKRGLSLASFGLEPPRARLTVGTDTHADQILLGDSSPLGNLFYLMHNDEKGVIGATVNIQEILPLVPEEFRDKAVFPSSIKQAVRLEVKHAGGFFQLALKDGIWRIQQPFDARADGTRVERLWRTLEALRIEGLDEGTAQADPSAYGLGNDEAALQVSVWTEGGRDPLIVTVGKARQDNPSQLYAKISDMKSLCLVQKDILALQAVQAVALRDRRLCDADLSAVAYLMLRDGDSKVVMEKGPSGVWMITEPLRFPANVRAVGSLLKGISGLQGDEMRGGEATNAIPADAEAMTCRLVVAKGIPSRIVTNETVSLLPAPQVWSYRMSWPDSAVSNSLVFSEESRTLYKVPAGDLAKFWRQLQGHDRPVFADPLVYMDCRMLDLNPKLVRRITLGSEGREETVTIGPDGAWSVDSPPSGQAIEGAIPALLALATDLQAERIEAVASTNLATYKLDESATRVTFGLSGAGGIKKTVLIGGSDGREGVYSMIQGQDVIFVLKKEIAQAFVRSLVLVP